MRESPDQHFDATVTRTLKFETLLPPSQQDAARARLLSRAAAQTMLPPLEAAAGERVTLRAHALVVRQRTRRLWNFLFVDAHVYERARRLPRFYQHYNVYGRRAYTVISLSA